MSKKADDKNHPPRQGSVSADDNDLLKWLHPLWARKEAPEKLEVWLVTGQKKDVRGPMIFHSDFKANDDKNPEECALLANTITSAAQHDCNVTQTKSWYEVAVIDRNRMAAPLSFRIGPFFPRTTYLTKPGGRPDGEDDDDDMPPARSLSLAYIKESYSQIRWEKEQIYQILGQTIMMQQQMIAEGRTENNVLRQSNASLFMTTQDALDRKEDRDDRREDRQVQRARDKLFADGLREAGRIAGVYAPGLFRALLPQSVAQQNEAAPPQQITVAQAQQPNQAPPNFGRSDERDYVEKFFAFIKDEKVGDVSVEEKLCGDWIDINGVMQPNPDPTKAGILRPDQVRLLVGLAKGWVDPNRVDELSPESNHPNAITGDQLMDAQSFVPQSALACVFELLGLRAEKRESATASKSTVN